MFSRPTTYSGTTLSYSESPLARRAPWGVWYVPAWSPKNVSGPNVTPSMPTSSTQYSKWRMNVSMLASTRSGLTIVVPGAASIPMTPPRSAHARMTSSGLHLLIGHSSRDPEWLMHTGAVEAAIVSRLVWSPAWLTSMRMPRRFIRSTARVPNPVSPPSVVSRQPDPSALDSL